MNREEKWLYNFELARKFYEKYGHLNIRIDTTIDGVKMGEWLSAQQTAYRKGCLSKEKILKLEDIGIIWSRRKNKNE